MKNNIKLFSYPLMLIGLTLILLGARWMIHDKPWMLDEVANVEKLNMEFSELFEIEKNKTLPGYLQQIYKFFGFWVIVIGLFLTTFSSPNFSKDQMIANRLLWIVGFMISIGQLLSYILIPSSHFIFLTWLMAALYCLSLFSYIERNKNKK